VFIEVAHGKKHVVMAGNREADGGRGGGFGEGTRGYPVCALYNAYSATIVSGRLGSRGMPLGLKDVLVVGAFGLFSATL
jgi:hypothetical protein